MKIKECVNKHAREIIVGVIVSVITAGIIKGIEWLKEIAPTAGNSIWRFFSNSFFVAAAKTMDTSLIAFLFAVLIGVAIAYVFIYARKALRITKKVISDAETTLDVINTPKVEGNNERKEITPQEIENEVKDIIKEARKGRKTAIVGILIFVLYFGRIFFFNLLPYGVWAEYQLDLLKIAPYIEQEELIEIKSDWACMQSKEDYDEIYRQIKEIKKEYELP